MAVGRVGGCGIAVGPGAVGDGAGVPAGVAGVVTGRLTGGSCTVAPPNAPEVPAVGAGCGGTG
ncbi:hypothetical protein, partial [Micromonospora echinofusca]|uniref:hypothetical protein n=1 Tax=Micromonospora echinofusca TaxID=47858 RepID=UPI001AD612AF